MYVVKHIIKSIESNGERVHDPRMISKIFNEYFASIYSVLPPQSVNHDALRDSYGNQSSSEPSIDIALHLEDVLDVLKRLRCKSETMITFHIK